MMTYLERLAARLDAAGIAYERWDLPRTDTAGITVKSAPPDYVSFTESSVMAEFDAFHDSRLLSAIVVAAEVWREMHEGEG